MCIFRWRKSHCIIFQFNTFHISIFISCTVTQTHLWFHWFPWRWLPVTAGLILISNEVTVNTTTATSARTLGAFGRQCAVVKVIIANDEVFIGYKTALTYEQWVSEWVVFNGTSTQFRLYAELDPKSRHRVTYSKGEPMLYKSCQRYINFA